MKLKKILLIYKKSLRSGLGHYNRMTYLNSHLKKYYKTKIIDIKNLNINILNKYDLIIFDINNYKIKKILNLNLKNKSITFDNFQNHLSKINLSIYEHNPSIKGLRFSGLKFISIGKKFKKFKKYKKSLNQNIFVSLGNNDTKKYIPQIIKILKKKKQFKIKIASKKDLIKNKIIFSSQKNYLKNFINSHICIVNAGVTLTEALYMNKLCYVLPQSELEKKFAKYLLKKNYILGVGINSLKKFNFKSKYKVYKNIKNLIDNKAHLRLSLIIKKYYK
ncbi:spsG Spore coat polysaccharide biosynthesis protein, predicted glycosyltransferase [Candidatus Pelagibacterales bacterium]